MSTNGSIYDNASHLERLYHINHIPYRYWKSKSEDISFTSFSYTPYEESKTKVDSKSQVGYYKDILKSIDETKNVKAFAGSFVCISSVPSEEGSMAAGCSLATAMIQKDPGANICIVDLSQTYDFDKSANYDLVILHNMTSESVNNRIQIARDFIKWATRSALCVLCTSGKNPLEMCYEVLRIPANMVLFSDERPNKITLDRG